MPGIGTDGQLAELGNDEFRVEITGALGGAPAAIFASFAEAEVPFLGLTILVDLGPAFFRDWPVVADGAVGVAGDGTATLGLAIPNDPSFLGLEVYFQGFVLDAGSAVGLSQTGGLRVEVF